MQWESSGKMITEFEFEMVDKFKMSGHSGERAELVGEGNRSAYSPERTLFSET